MIKKIVKWTFIGLLMIILLIYLIILGGPIKQELKVGSCSTKYVFYLTNNIYCNGRTSGHCPDNDFEMLNAQNRIGNCLSEKYLNSKNKEDSLFIIDILKSNPSSMDNYVNLKTIQQNQIDVDFVCKNRAIIFGALTIE